MERCDRSERRRHGAILNRFKTMKAKQQHVMRDDEKSTPEQIKVLEERYRK